MPIIGWKCPIHRDEVPFDHFDTCTAMNGRSPVPIWMARYAAEKITGDTRHLSLDITATRVLTCPRQIYLMHAFDHYVDPTKRASADRGTALHSVAGRYMGDAWWTEATDRVRLCIEGTLFGVPISAQADAIKKDLSEIADHKFPSDFSVQWRKAKGGQLTRTTKVGADYCVQLNIIRLLLAQQPWAIDAGYDPLNVMMTVWDHATGKDQGPEPLAVSDYMSEEEIAAYRPGGETTVAEITQWLAYIKQEHKGCTTMKDRERLAAGIPLIGLPMLGGNKCQHYCEVSEKCGTLSRQYGVPETVDEAA